MADRRYGIPTESDDVIRPRDFENEGPARQAGPIRSQLNDLDVVAHELHRMVDVIGERFIEVLTPEQDTKNGLAPQADASSESPLEHRLRDLNETLRALRGRLGEFEDRCAL